MYKQIKDFPNYKINKLGKVKNIKTGKFICIKLNNKKEWKHIHK